MYLASVEPNVDISFRDVAGHMGASELGLVHSFHMPSCSPPFPIVGEVPVEDNVKLVCIAGASVSLDA